MLYTATIEAIEVTKENLDALKEFATKHGYKFRADVYLGELEEVVMISNAKGRVFAPQGWYLYVNKFGYVKATSWQNFEDIFKIKTDIENGNTTADSAERTTTDGRN